MERNLENLRDLLLRNVVVNEFDVVIVSDTFLDVPHVFLAQTLKRL